MNSTHSILCAPLQGYTDSVWRNAHCRIFGGIDKYYTPFARIEHGEIPKRDLRDISPESNTAPIVPQIIACQHENVVRLALAVKEMGYDTIDINLGCPFPPIALHHKGSGLLQHPHEVKEMMHSLSQIDGVRFSVKMRLGWDDARQWRDILPILNDYNVAQVTIHPRIGRQQYKGDLMIDEMQEFLDMCTMPVIFNGGICDKADTDCIYERWPSLSGVMVGRGLVANPASMSEKALSADDVEEFHTELLDGYADKLCGGEPQLLRKMQSLWDLMLPEADHKARKMIRKATTMAKYEQAVRMLINSLKT